MALDLLNGKVRILNYELSPVCFPSQHDKNGIIIRGREEDETFVIERVAFDDIESENTKSDLFKIGRLRFVPEEENEVYKKLGIEDRDNIKSDKELQLILKDDSIDNIKWISNLKSTTLLLRMKRILFSLERNGKPVHHNITSVVNERINELKYGGKRNENSEINRILKDDQKKREESKLKETLELLSEKVEKLEKENNEKDALLNKSQSALELLLKQVEDLKNEGNKTVVENKSKATMTKRTNNKTSK